MQVIELRDGFGLDNLVGGERETPRPGRGQILIEMRAASLNYRDLLMVRGQYNPKQPLPLIPCSDGVGDVVEVGPDVDRVMVGDRVSPIFAQRWLAGKPTPKRLRSTLGGPLDGTLARFMVVDAQSVVKVPLHLSAPEAATLPCAGLTAWTALVEHGELRAGQTVLIQGTGGVSIFALQFASLLGARPIVISSSDEKLERVREMGAWGTVNYREHPGWAREVRALTGGRGVDLIVEVGGAGTLGQSLEAIAFGGRISQIGVLAGVAGEVNVTPLLMQQVRLQGVLVGHREAYEDMNRAIVHSELRPIVDRTMPWVEARQALEHLASGKHFGKICLEISK